MGTDESAEDGGEFRLPLPPQDRLWRHPSELGALAAAGQISPAAAVDGTRWPWGVALMSAVGGALAVSALWLALGFDPQIIRVTNHVSSQPYTTEPPRVITVDEWARELEAAARPSAVGLSGAEGEQLSGFGYLDDGHLLTSADRLGAVAGAEIDVTLADGTSAVGSVLGTDPVSDLAVVHIDAEAPIPIAATAEHPVVSVGDGVVVVGHHAAVMATVVSFDHAMRDRDGELRFEVFGLEGSFDPTLAGSPVVDSTGAVIGIITVVDESSAYAVAADTAREVADQIIADGDVSHEGWIGVRLVDVSASDVEPFAVQPFLPAPLGGAVEVSDVVVDGPAAVLHTGDWIIHVDDRPIASRDELRRYVSDLAPGTTVTLYVLEAPIQGLDGSIVRTPAIYPIEIGGRPPSDR